MPNPKVLIGIVGVDQHEVGARSVARYLRDAGMEVVYAGRFNLAPDIVNMAIEEDVSVIGLSCHSWEYQYYVPEIVALLGEQGLDIPLVIGGSVISEQDRQRALSQGVSAAFGPGSKPGEIVESIRSLASPTVDKPSV